MRIQNRKIVSDHPLITWYNMCYPWLFSRATQLKFPAWNEGKQNKQKNKTSKCSADSWSKLNLALFFHFTVTPKVSQCHSNQCGCVIYKKATTIQFQRPHPRAYTTPDQCQHKDFLAERKEEKKSTIFFSFEKIVLFFFFCSRHKYNKLRWIRTCDENTTFKFILLPLWTWYSITITKLTSVVDWA